SPSFPPFPLLLLLPFLPSSPLSRLLPFHPALRDLHSIRLRRNRRRGRGSRRLARGAIVPFGACSSDAARLRWLCSRWSESSRRTPELLCSESDDPWHRAPRDA